MIPIFDALAHPTLTGHWLRSGRDASFAALAASLAHAGFIGAAAVGISGVEDYEDEEFIRRCGAHAGLLPVAGFNPQHPGTARAELQRLRDLGYRAIKIHPRLTGLRLDGPQLGEAFAAAHAFDMTVFFCTYQHCRIEHYPEADPFFALVRALKVAPKTKIVLLHGGDVQLLRYAELVRFNDQLMLDLSLTMLKYAGSSLDSDIAFLFRSFDRRICIGSDHPEYTHQQVRERFEFFADAIPSDKAENIAYRNITSFLGFGGKASRS